MTECVSECVSACVVTECMTECVSAWLSACSITVPQSHSRRQQSFQVLCGQERCEWKSRVVRSVGDFDEIHRLLPDNCPGTSDYDPKRPMSGGTGLGKD